MGMEVRTWRREQVFSSKRRKTTQHWASVYCFGCGAPWWIKEVTIVGCSGPLFFFDYQGISLARVESRDQ